MADLILLQDYKTYASITSVEQDARISNIITYTSDFIKRYCGRTFIDYYDTNTMQYLPITEYWGGGHTFYDTVEFPVRSVISVELSSDLGETYTTLTNAVDYAYDKAKDRLFIADGESNESINAYKITYTGGFSETPASLKAAALDLVDYYVKQESTPKRVQNFVSVEYIKTSDLPHHIKRVLDLYRVI